MSQRLNKLCRISLGMLVAIATVCLSQSVHAQSRGSSANADGVEQSARAAWQPVRDLSRQPSNQRAAAAVIQPVNHEVATVSSRAPAPSQRKTTPVRPASNSVLTHPIITHESVPMDGQIVFEPMHDYGCDAIPIGSGGCDGIGCSSGRCGSGDPMCGEYRDCDSLRPCLTLCWPQDGWFTAEYLMWWQDGMNLPPLASTGRLSGREPFANGRVVYGNEKVLTDNFDGMRFDGGFWFDKCHTWGIGGGAFGLDRRTDRFSSGPQDGIVGRPIITVLDNPAPNGDELGEAFAKVNGASGDVGTLNIDVDSRLRGWDIYARHLRGTDQGCMPGGPCSCPTRWCSRSEYRVGFRNVELDEGIAIDSNCACDPPATFRLNESFRTRNEFNGVDFGWSHTRKVDYWNFDLGLRLAVGNTRQRVNIAGSTIFNGTGPAVPGGLLALNSNIGTYERDEFSVLPEFNAKLGYQLTDQLRATFGYTFLYMSNVVRPGDQIDRIIDLAQVPNSNAPTPTGVFPRFAFDNTDYWAQGLSFGLDYRW